MQVLSEVSEKQVIHLQIPVELAEEKILIQNTLEKKRTQLFLKRVFDVVVASILILLLSPILLVVAVLIKLSSKGDILYSNERVGYGGRNFRCYKFRSMISDQSEKAQAYKAALEQQQKGILLKLPNDPRVTWIGKIIRKSSIDELPQLFNVLLGDMSIVGPRPLVPFMLAHLPEFKAIRCLMRPGITGLWQIRDRINNTSAEFMIEHDTEYIKDYSLMMDLKILLSTPKVVLSAEGAY
ncbi:sugar transferase [Ilyomonas limi]|uniref:Sugar transferase n=1 Tax=Ilyomonas limi TaxID=2575867 RepID=A0A4U3KT23_9BACT|nr:sugar transferase [Ilyomonas limi]TKK65645.1 sugar transferase [Ilyomonas limi]